MNDKAKQVSQLLDDNRMDTNARDLDRQALILARAIRKNDAACAVMAVLCVRSIIGTDSGAQARTWQAFIKRTHALVDDEYSSTCREALRDAVEADYRHRCELELAAMRGDDTIC